MDQENVDKLNKQVCKARSFYSENKDVWCPYFSSRITLNSDGFNHLLHKPNRQPRNVNEQLLKLSLLSKAIDVIRKSGTLQEYRYRIESFGSPAKDGFRKTLMVQYWAFHAILGSDRKIKIVVVLRKVGEGKLTFWSVLPHKKFNNQKLYTEGIEEE